MDVTEAIRNALASTRLYEADEHPSWRGQKRDGTRHSTRVRVDDCSTIGAARSLVAEGGDRSSVAILNFASGTNPGGGFLKGGAAQEEDNCLCSALYCCLAQDRVSGFYDRNIHGGKKLGGARLYSDAVIYAADVPVFRNDSTYELLEMPVGVSVISAAAVNCRGVCSTGRRNADDGAIDVRRGMERRMRKILAIAAQNRHTSLVLGAFGCGVFRGDVDFVAATWMRLLMGEFEGVFEQVVFAILSNGQGGSDDDDNDDDDLEFSSTLSHFRAVVAA